MVQKPDPRRVDVGEQLVDEVGIRGDDLGHGGKVDVLLIDFLEETHPRQGVACQFLLVQDCRLAEEVALKEDIAERHRLMELLLGFDFLCEQPYVAWQDLTQFLTFLGIGCDAEVDLDDVCHFDERLVAGQENEVVEGDLVALCLEFPYCLHDLRRRLHVFENFYDDVFRRKEFWCAVQQVLLGEVDECLFVGNQFL